MLNKVILIGRMTRDAELRSTPQGISTCSFTLAVERNYQSAEGERQADFINCVSWRGTAEFISKHFQKGNAICVEGSIQTRSWKDNEGNNRYATEVVVDRAYFVESKKQAEGLGVEDSSVAGSLFNAAMLGNDDLPYPR